MARANRILLVLRRIIGDTGGMVLGSTHGFGTGYDLLLTSTTRTSITPILLTARIGWDKEPQPPGLKSKGLGGVARLMGGLVDRWIIGNADKVAQGWCRVLHSRAGTGGSPSADHHRARRSASSARPEQAAGHVAPADVLAGLVALVEKMDQTLDEIKRDRTR